MNKIITRLCPSRLDSDTQMSTAHVENEDISCYPKTLVKPTLDDTLQ